MEQPAALTLPDPPTSALGASPAFVVELEAFSGPLDLLLHLLREEELEIADIPIARIADQFLLVIHDLGLNQAADYLEMAGRLLRLKAQMLLPRRSEEDGWEDPRAELVRRLLEYQQIREVALWLGRAAERRADQYARGLPPGAAGPPAAAAPGRPRGAAAGGPARHRGDPRRRSCTAWWRARSTSKAPPRRLNALLEEREEFGWREALGPAPTITDVLSTLLALLELARRGAVSLTQAAAFAPMVIRRDASRAAD